MKEGFIHVCFVIDKSGSMYSSRSDVVGGFAKVIDEQQANTEGSCAVSLYTFDNNVHQEYIMKDVKEITNQLNYHPDGCTAMNDGIGTAITEIGAKLRDMPESERPEKNLVVIMTDGYENASKEYSISQIRDMIKEQTEKYSWTFIYMGADVTDTSYADALGVKGSYGDRGDLGANFACLDAVVSDYRCSDASYSVKNAHLERTLCAAADATTAAYAAKVGKKIQQKTQIKLSAD